LITLELDQTQKRMKATTPKPVIQGHDVDLAESLKASDILVPNVLNKARYADLISIKEKRNGDLIAKSKMFFFLGLSLSLIFVTLVMNWKTYDKAELVDLGNLEADFDDLIEVPVSVQPPPAPPKQNQVVQIVEVDDEVIIEEIELNIDVEMSEETHIEEHNIDFTVDPVEEEVIEEVFTIVENYPAPPGGMEAFYSFIGENIDYPAMARRLNVSGIVFVQFVVEKNGEITDVKVIRGIGAGCDEEAVRVLRSAPAWNPGKQRGQPVRVLMTVPIRFVLTK
jgi:protein TonB